MAAFGPVEAKPSSPLPPGIEEQLWTGCKEKVGHVQRLEEEHALLVPALCPMPMATQCQRACRPSSQLCCWAGDPSPSPCLSSRWG